MFEVITERPTHHDDTRSEAVLAHAALQAVRYIVSRLHGFTNVQSESLQAAEAHLKRAAECLEDFARLRQA